MRRVGFEGFSPELFSFLKGLGENNSKAWFDDHRDQYEKDVLGSLKAFVGDLGPILKMMNQELETEPKVGRTLSRISNDMRFHKNRPPYRPFIYIGFPRFGKKRSTEALLYLGIYSHGVSVGFYPGGHCELRTGPIQKSIKANLGLFQKYLEERRVHKHYWELAGGENGSITKWPLPKTARRWINLESFTVGEYFPAGDPRLSSQQFLDRAQSVLVDLYPLWLFATSENLKGELDLYHENVVPLSKPLTKAMRSRTEKRFVRSETGRWKEADRLIPKHSNSGD
jgi:uncharacterized protein (TIGR02453 family)